jgi:mycoredoxin
MSAKVELYGTAGCPWTTELRQELEWDGHEFVEYDVEVDPAASERLAALTGGQRAVPVLVEDGKVRQIGYQGRTCMAAPPPSPASPTC